MGQKLLKKLLQELSNSLLGRLPNIRKPPSNSMISSWRAAKRGGLEWAERSVALNSCSHAHPPGLSGNGRAIDLKICNPLEKEVLLF